MKKTGAERITRCLERQEIDPFAGVLGGASLPFHDAERVPDRHHALDLFIQEVMPEFYAGGPA